MLKTRVHVLVFVTLLAGCGSVSRTIEPDPILPTPNDRIPLPSGYVTSDGKVNCELAAVAAEGSIPAEIEQFSQAMYCAYTVTGASNQEWIRRFVEKGIGLSDQTCGLFFDSLEKRRVETAYYQTNMNIAGTAVTAILVGAGHHARSAFNVATGLSFGNAWFENYKANYVFTPQLGKLHMKLKTEVRKPIGYEMKRLASSNQYASFDQAKVDLQSYDELCSHKSIVYLLDDVLAAAKIETYSAGPTDLEKNQAKVLTEDLYQRVTGASGSFNDTQLERLYVIATTPGAGTRKQVSDFFTSADATLTPFVTSLKLADPVPEATGVASLLSIGQFLKLGDSSAVRQFRLLATKAVEVNNAAAPAPAAPAPAPALAPAPAPAPAPAAAASAPKPRVTATAAEIESLKAVKPNPRSPSGDGANFLFRAVRPAVQ